MNFYKKNNNINILVLKKRYFIFIITVFLLGLFLFYKLVSLQLFNRDFLQKQGDARVIRVVNIPSTRGMLLDRNNEPLAISIPVKSIWVNPKEFKKNLNEKIKLRLLSEYLSIPPKEISHKVSKYVSRDKEFLYLKRQVDPDTEKKVTALKLEGLYFSTEYKRFYPHGDVSAHVIGFTDIDDNGQEGLELAFNNILKGKDGKKRIIRDRLGREIEYLETIAQVQHGQDIQLTIDQRLQYLAYRELKSAIKKHEAISGSVVILDVDTGEILAMVNWPSYNPNQRKIKQDLELIRNRAVTDLFEPASSIKPFSMLSVLEHNNIPLDTLVDTNPGYLKILNGVVRDLKNHGVLNLEGVLKHSSNVGIVKLTGLLESPIDLWDTYDKLGFGNKTESMFPGESSGILLQSNTEHPFVLATMSFGYGFAVTPLQLARAYAILAASGNKKPISFIKLYEKQNGFQIIKSDIANTIIKMLERVAAEKASKAKVIGYNVAGKTGTARKLGSDGYEKGKHRAIYGGIAPATNPKFAIVVTINEPSKGGYYGNLVAAPVFAKIAQNALRLYKVKPNKFDQNIVISKSENN